jgi:hypothetical protein
MRPTMQDSYPKNPADMIEDVEVGSGVCIVS